MKTEILCLASKLVLVKNKNKNKRLVKFKKNNNTIQNQKRDINREQKKDRLYYYGVFKEALSNVKNWVK